MQQIDLTVTNKQTLKAAMWEITLAGEELTTQSQAGQFYLVQCADRFSTYLRRVVFPIFLQPSNSTDRSNVPPGLQIILSAGDTTDPGLAWLASRRRGEKVNVLGPLGRGFTIPKAKNLLLVGSGVHIGPLLGLARAASQSNINVVLALESLRAADLYPPHRLPPTVELRVATVDGNLGHQGRIIDHLDELALWADAVCAVGSTEFYQQLKTHLAQKRMHLSSDFAQVLITEAPIHVCGVGVCALCPIATEKGLKMVCQDGPVFDLTALSLEVRDD
jgi:dihydroorotate dehydrogenase electron transfer subunit